MRTRKHRDYFVSGVGGWYVVSAFNMASVRQHAAAEYGPENVREIRPATQEEVDTYLEWKGLASVPFIDSDGHEVQP